MAGNEKIGQPGFERSPTSEYLEKLSEMDAMRQRFKALNESQSASKRVKDFIKRYGDFMAEDNYRASHPESFISKANDLIAEGEELLSEVRTEK